MRFRVPDPELYINESMFDKEWPYHVMLDLNYTGYTIQKCKDRATAETFIMNFMHDWEEEMTR